MGLYGKKYSPPHNPVKGEKHHKSKVTESEVQEIRRRYAQGGISQRKLGKQYGISGDAVNKIVNFKTWK